MSDSWLLTLPCTRAEAVAVAAAEIEAVTLVTTEEDEAAERWRLYAYFEGEPDVATLAAVRALVAAPGDVAPGALPEQDWVTLSQAGLEPIREGRFVVHTAAYPAEPPPGGRAFPDRGRAGPSGRGITRRPPAAWRCSTRSPSRDSIAGTSSISAPARASSPLPPPSCGPTPPSSRPTTIRSP